MSLATSRSESGSGLVEQLVATAVFMIGAVGLVQLLTVTMAANTSSRNLTAAVNLAQDRVERIRNTSLAAVTGGSDGPLTETGAAGGVFSRSWTVDDATIDGAKQVTVTVSWLEHGSREVELHTVVW